MINLVGADALMSTFNARYHYLFWRPVTVIDPTAVIADGFGPVPGYDDGNLATVEQTGWRPLMTTPNHPEYPSAHGSITPERWPRSSPPSSARTRSTLTYLRVRACRAAWEPERGTALRHVERPPPRDHRRPSRAGFHYRFSDVAALVLGRQVANFDLRHAFRPVE